MKNKVLKAGFGYTIGNYLLKGLAFFTIPIFARLLTPQEYGKYNTFIAYESLFFIIIGLAIHSSYKNALYKYKALEDGIDNRMNYYCYVSTTLVMIAFFLLLWLFIANSFSNYFISLLKLDIFSINLLIIFSFSNAILCCYNTDVSIRYDYKKFLMIATINAILSIALSIYLISNIQQFDKYLGRVIGTVIPLFLISLWIIFHYLKKARPGNYVSFLSWGLSYSLPIVPHGISQILLSQFDRIMINNMIGTYEAGIYSFAYNLFSIIAITASSIENVWGPWFYEKMKASEHSAIYEKSKYYFILLCILASCLILISPELILILGGNKYIESVYISIPLITSGFFAYSYNIPVGVEYYYSKTWYIAFGTILAALINIGLNYYVISSKYNYLYVGYTTLFTYFLYFCFHYYLALRIQKRNLFSITTLFGCFALLLIIHSITFYFIHSKILRVSFFIIIIISSILYLEKKIKFGTKIYSRLMKFLDNLI